MTQLESSDQGVVCDSHKTSLIFFSFHAEIWSPKEISLESLFACMTRQVPLWTGLRGRTRLAVKKGQALTCLRVSARNTVRHPPSLCFWLH